MKNLLTLCAAVVLAAVSSVSSAQLVRPESLPTGFVIVVEDQSKSAGASKPIYMASSANSWDPGDPAYRLDPRSDTRWQIVIGPDQLGENVEFKFTLGGWSTVELDAEGQEIANRTLPAVDLRNWAEGEKPVIELTVPRFRDGSEQHVIAEEYRPLNGTGTLRRLAVSGGAGRAQGEMRDLLVWLPPGYDAAENAERRYPVLYMLDGQNVFQKPSTAPGEWKLDETAQAMVSAGLIEPFVAVAIPSLPEARVQEYMAPLPGAPREYRGARPEGDEFLRWLRYHVMPRVERAFRVSTERDKTAIGGASLGGTMALTAAIEHGDRFGRVLAESPALFVADASFWRTGLLTVSAAERQRVYLGMGGNETIEGTNGFYNAGTRAHVTQTRELYEAIRRSADAALFVVDEHRHDELAWAERLPAALSFLFAPVSEEERAQAARAEAERAAAMVPAETLDGGVRLIVTDAAGVAGEGLPIHLASNHNNWNPGDPATRLERLGDGVWAIDVPPPDSRERMQFKFALGDWRRVELSPAGEQIENRTLPLVDARLYDSGGRPTFAFTIERWDDPANAEAPRSRPPAHTGHVEMLSVSGPDGTPRTVRVWLPASYEEHASASRRYPLLLLMDGQNVFDAPPGIPGEWHADEIATALLAAGEIEPLIIAAIDHAGRDRVHEYVPYDTALDGVSPRGEAFVEWLAGSVVPALRDGFKIEADASRVAIGGSSLGAVIAMHAATRRPDLFGMLLLESCSMLSAGGGPVLTSLDGAAGWPSRVVIGMGGQEVGSAGVDAPRNAQYRDWARTLDARFAAAGVGERLVTITPGHHHNETAWAERLPAALAFLFPLR